MIKLLSALATLSVSQLAFGLNCTACGDPVADYRNYGSFFYTNTVGRGSLSRTATPLSAHRGIVTNSTNGQYAEVHIDSAEATFTWFGVPMPFPSRELTITVVAPTGVATSYQVLSGSKSFLVPAPVKLKPVFDKTPKPQPRLPTAPQLSASDQHGPYTFALSRNPDGDRVSGSPVIPIVECLDGCDSVTR